MEHNLLYGITQCYLPTDTGERNAARLNHSQTGLYLIYPPRRDKSWKAELTKVRSFVSGMHHYECIAPNVDINLQSGRFHVKRGPCQLLHSRTGSLISGPAE